MKRATSGDIQIAYDDVGSGDVAVLLLAGWGGSRRVFRKIVPRLAETHRVLALDWRGHGDSDASPGDFGFDECVADALAVVNASGISRIVPVSMAHAGWVAHELLARLGHTRVPAVALLDWIVLDPPPPFLGALAALQDPASWSGVRDKLLEKWQGTSKDEDVAAFLRDEMLTTSGAMWQRAGREIARAYAAKKNPLDAFRTLASGARVLHAYTQPRDEAYLEAQRAFSADNPWFDVKRLEGSTHFPTLENPDAVVATLRDFVGYFDRPRAVRT